MSPKLFSWLICSIYRLFYFHKKREKKEPSEHGAMTKRRGYLTDEYNLISIGIYSMLNIKKPMLGGPEWIDLEVAFVDRIQLRH